MIIKGLLIKMTTEFLGISQVDFRTAASESCNTAGIDSKDTQLSL